MSVILFKDGKSEVFDEYTFVDRLKEGWSLEGGGEAHTVNGDPPAVGNWVHPGELPDNPTDNQVTEFADNAEIPYASMKNSDTLKKELGYEYQG